MSEPFLSSFLEDISKKAILEAGQIAISLKDSVTVRYKSENQPVTNVDVKIDNFLKSFLKKTLPLMVGYLKNQMMMDQDLVLSFFGV